MGIISNIFGFGKAPASPNADLFAKFERSSLLMATPQQLSENRNALHDLFSSKNWENLSFEDKKAAVQALENDFSFQQGRPAKTVEVTGLEDGCYGGWSARADKIYLNENLVKNGSLYSDEYATAMSDANIQIFDTIAHEGYHAYQSYALENPDVHEDKAQLREWALNEGRYYDSGAEYNIQPKERDAWQYGNAQTVAAFYGIEQRNGPELGMDDYNAMCQTNSYSEKLAQAQSREPDVLDHMEQEMMEACDEKGINYDFGESRSEGYAAKAEEAVLEREAPPEMVNAPPEETHKMTIDELMTPQSEMPQQEKKMSIEELMATQEEISQQNAPQQENIISLDAIAAEASQSENAQQEKTEKMSIEDLMAPQTEMKAETQEASMDSAPSAPAQDNSEEISETQSYSL